MLCLLTRYSSIGFLLSRKIDDRKHCEQNLSKFDFYDIKNKKNRCFYAKVIAPVNKEAKKNKD